MAAAKSPGENGETCQRLGHKKNKSKMSDVLRFVVCTPDVDFYEDHHFL